MIDQIQRWSGLAGLAATVADSGPPFRVRLRLEDIRPPMVLEVLGPAAADDPYRITTGFELPPSSSSSLPAARVGEIVEAAVLGRSALADARPRNDGTGVEMIAVIYPDGLTRHSFMTAIYECQKLRQIITREVEAALVSESALASLLALAETSEELATATAAAPPHGIPGEPFGGAGTSAAPFAPEPAPRPAPATPTAWDAPEPAAPNPVPAPAAPPAPAVVDPLLGPAPAPSPTTPAPPTWDPPPLPDVPPPLPPDLPEGPDR